MLELYEKVVQASLADIYPKLGLLSLQEGRFEKELSVLARKVVDFERQLASISVPASVCFSHSS